MQDDRLLNLPFDLYERYALTRRVVGLLWPESQGRLRILDVGGQSSPLKLLLPEHTVVLADVGPPRSLTALQARLDAYVEASSARLPFADGSFDLVTAHDTVEHLAADQHAALVTEMLRVTRRFVLLNRPIRGPNVEWAEARLARFLESVVNEKNQLLHEHAAMGLPSPDEIESMLGNASFIRVPNGSTRDWVVMNALMTYLGQLPEGRPLASTVERTFNQLRAGRGSEGPWYREAFLASSDPADAELLARVRDLPGMDPGTEPVDLVKVLEPLIAALEKHSTDVRSLMDSHANAMHELQRKDQELAEAEAELEQISRSASHQLGIRVRSGVDRVAPWGTRRRTLIHYLLEGVRVFLNEGWEEVFHRVLNFRRWGGRFLRKGLPLGAALPINEQYRLWLRRNALTSEVVGRMHEDIARFDYRPRISIVMPVFNSEPSWLRAAVDSVRRQVYTEWQLCIADDGSTRPETLQALEAIEGHDERIRISRSEVNAGISAASNGALAMATGEFVGFLDHDDELKPDSLFEVVRLLNEQRDLDYIYSDEDKRNLDGRLVDPFFKPDWSPDLLMSVNYVTHFSVFRKELVDRLGGFRVGYDGSQDYDLVLRVADETVRIAHIPRPLYTWRKVAGSAAASDDAKPFAYEAAKKALGDALARRGLRGDVLDGPRRGYYRTRYAIDGSPAVAVVIPTRDKVDLLRRCIDSVREKSTYRNLEIFVVDNESRESETLEYLSGLDGHVLPYRHEFNFSKIVNFSAENVDAPYLLFLNNDTEIISPDWVEAMLEHGQRPEVAAVGARLLYPDGRPQHEGIVVGPRDGLAGNLDHRGYFALGLTIRDCSAVTAACMLTRRAVFLELGGFTEQLRVAYNDVDYCLRAQEKGYLIVYTPYARLYHHEGGTRGRTGQTHPVEDERVFRDRWRNHRDPYYNPNFDVDNPFNLKL